jgi:hypothetical protein
MFKLLKKLQGAQSPAEDYEKIMLHEYQGQVISSEYNVNDPYEYPYHALFPHGDGKIKYIYDGEVVEEYEGEFDGGQYSGKGKLTKNGKVFEGEFSNNKFVG